MFYLINLPVRSLDTRSIQSLGIAYIAAELLNEGHQVKIIDGCGIHKNMNMSEIESMIMSDLPEYVGFYTLEFNIDETISLIDDLKANYDFISFLGGPQASLDYKHIFDNHPSIDFIILGESEHKISRILNGDSNVSGALSRNRNGIISNPHTLINDIDLDEILFPIRELDGLPLLTKEFFMGETFYVAPISSSRGCPFNCAFCSVPALTAQNKIKWRFRSTDSVLWEIRSIFSKFPKLKIVFIDDNFLVDFDRAMDIAIGIHQIGDIYFSFSARVESVLRIQTADLVRLKALGLQAIEIGIENFNDNVLKRYRKGHSSTEAILVLQKLQKMGFTLAIDFIMFDPWSTLNELQHNINIIESNGWECFFSDVLCNRLYPFVGTELYNQVNLENYFFDSKVDMVYKKIKWYYENYHKKVMDIALSTLSFVEMTICLKAPFKIFKYIVADPYIDAQKIPDLIEIKRIIASAY